MVDEVISDDVLRVMVDASGQENCLVSVTVGYLQKLAAELERHRAAAKARAAVPMPISRERLERIAESGWCWFSAQEQEALARFALAHMQQPLHSEAAKETEPTFRGVPVGYERNLERAPGDCEPPTLPVTIDVEESKRLRTALLATVHHSSEVDTVRRAAMALLGE